MKTLETMLDADARKAKKNILAMRDELKALGMSVTFTEYDEYRVNFKGGKEATAYYTNCPFDAIATARAMSKQKAGGRPTTGDVTADSILNSWIALDKKGAN